MDICHLKNAVLETEHQKYQGRALRGDIVKDDSGSYAVFTEQGSSSSQMTTAKVMDIISRLPGCLGQEADAVSAKTKERMEDAPKLLKIPKSECPDIWIGLPRHKWPKSWSSMEDPVGHPLAGLLWDMQFGKILLKYGWEQVPNWECLFVHREKGLFLSVYVDDIKLAGKKQNIVPMWKVLNKELDLGEPTSFLDHVYLGCTQRQCEIMILWTITEPCLNPDFLREQLQNYHARKICVFLRGLMTWLVMQRNVWNDIVSWQTRRPNNSTRVSTPCIDDHHFKEEDLKIRGRIVKRVLSNCSEMLIIGTYWKTRHSVVSEQTCTIDHKMDQSL